MGAIEEDDHMQPFELGVVTDEIDANLDRACSVAAELGMSVVELNTIWGRQAETLDDGDVARVCAIVGRYHLRVDAMGTPAFKAIELSKTPDFGTSESFAQHLHIIRRAARIARTLGSLAPEPAVRIFTFRREGMVGLGNPSPILPDGGGLPNQILERIVEGLTLACRVAREEGVRLLVENVRSCWANTGVHAAQIVAATDRPELGVIWDVANDFVSCGQPYHAGYEATRPYAVCAHIKDARIVDATTGLTAWMPVGHGEVDTTGQIAALLRDGFPGPLLLETHWRGDGLTAEESSRQSFAGLVAAIERAGGTVDTARP